MGRCWIVLLCLIATAPGRAAEPSLFGSALDAWLGDRDVWAFTLHVREFGDQHRLKEERLERYDPSQPDTQRWTLLQINGRAPTSAEIDAFAERKNRKKRRHAVKSPADYIDFGRVAVAAESAEQVRYEVPLREDASWLVPIEKLAVAVTVNKDHRCIEQVTAGLREPFRIAFGLARVTDVAFDLRIDPARPATTQSPNGTARMTIFKLGHRADFAWSDFRRVAP
ncbi:MAG TPA: hypothetical protein VGD81_13225 [Opitutaceae bacterium]